MSFKALLALTLLAAPAAYAGDMAFLDEARSVFAQTVGDLQGCGLTLLDHEDPRLPRPQVPADDAVVGRFGQLLAYTNFESGLGNLLEFKAPNGGQSHSITFTSEDIRYTTPYAGTVAIQTRFRTVDGWHHRFLCQSQYVSFAVYQDCVKRLWTDVVTGQLCR
jgi:hypothetical protein